jgi:hypothetical protein
MNIPGIVWPTWCLLSPHAVSVSRASISHQHTILNIRLIGFSYSDDDSMYTTGDSETAQLNYELIMQFFERFPAFLSNDMYISSESYGGHCKYSAYHPINVCYCISEILAKYRWLYLV